MRMPIIIPDRRIFVFGLSVGPFVRLFRHDATVTDFVNFSTFLGSSQRHSTAATSCGGLGWLRYLGWSR